MTDTAGFPLGDKLVRVECHIKTEIIINHQLKGFACQALTFVFIDGAWLDDFVRPEAIAVNSAKSPEFFQEFWNQYGMMLFASGIYQLWNPAMRTHLSQQARV